MKRNLPADDHTPTQSRPDLSRVNFGVKVRIADDRANLWLGWQLLQHIKSSVKIKIHLLLRSSANYSFETILNDFFLLEVTSQKFSVPHIFSHHIFSLLYIFLIQGKTDTERSFLASDQHGVRYEDRFVLLVEAVISRPCGTQIIVNFNPHLIYDVPACRFLKHFSEIRVLLSLEFIQIPSIESIQGKEKYSIFVGSFYQPMLLSPSSATIMSIDCCHNYIMRHHSLFQVNGIQNIILQNDGLRLVSFSKLFLHCIRHSFTWSVYIHLSIHKDGDVLIVIGMVQKAAPDELRSSQPLQNFGWDMMA